MSLSELCYGRMQAVFILFPFTIMWVLASNFFLPPHLQ